MKNLHVSSVGGALAGGVVAYLLGAGRLVAVIGVSGALMVVWLIESYHHHRLAAGAGPPWFSLPSFFVEEQEDDSE